MQNRITYYILSLLYLNGRVRIPGLGKIEQTPEKARIGDEDGSISAPQSLNTFSEGQGKSRLLEKYVAYRENTSRTRARREIDRFSTKIQSEIKKEGNVELQYLGEFSKEDDAVVFSPNEEILNPGFAALNPIPLPRRLGSFEAPKATPTVRAHTSIEESVAVGPEDKFPEEETPVEVVMPAVLEFEPILPEVEIAAASTSSPEEKTEPFAPILPHVPQTKAPDIQGTAPISKSQTTVIKEEREYPLFMPIAAVFLVAILATAFLFYQSRISHRQSAMVDDAQVTTENVYEAQSDLSITNTDNNKAVEEVAEDGGQGDMKIALADTGRRSEPDSNHNGDSFNSADIEPVTTSSVEAEYVHPATGDCLIVVGAFSRSENVDRMLRRLQSMGYPARTHPRGQLTQVGVSVDCKTYDLEVVLDFLRKNVEQKAWVIKPK